MIDNLLIQQQIGVYVFLAIIAAAAVIKIFNVLTRSSSSDARDATD